MSPEQVDLVRASFAQVRPIAEQAGLMFYARLFELAPELRSMFPQDIEPQSKKLMQLLALAVNSLDQLDAIVPAVEALGVRHADYGVEEAHYDIVAAALLDTVQQGLGDAFTPDVRNAWTQTYLVLAGIMKNAAQTSKTAVA